MRGTGNTVTGILVAGLLGTMGIAALGGAFEPDELVRADTVVVTRVDTVALRVEHDTVYAEHPTAALDPNAGCIFEIHLENEPDKTIYATHVDWDGDGGGWSTRNRGMRYLDGYRDCQGNVVKLRAEPASVFYFGH